MMKPRLVVTAPLLLVVAASTTLYGCDDSNTYVNWNDAGVTGSGGGGSETDAGTDAADDADDAGPSTDGGQNGCDTPCEGECRPSQPQGFSAVRLVWFGAAAEEPPPCPSNASEHETIVHAEPNIPAASCSECTCGPSEGSCLLPSTITAHSATCDALGGSLAIETDPPLSWSGECSAENPIPSGIVCNGLPCVQSVTLGALTITDDKCAPSTPSTEPLPSPNWQLSAKICEGSAIGTCDPDEQCAPANSEGFRQCIEQSGIHDCPSDAYPDRFVYYDTFDDTRQCSACTCGSPEGSVCSAWISLYKDSVCTGLALHASASSEKSSCHDMTPAAWSIGARSASDLVYSAGICQASGGDLVGEVLPSGPRTLCCLP